MRKIREWKMTNGEKRRGRKIRLGRRTGKFRKMRKKRSFAAVTVSSLSLFF